MTKQITGAAMAIVLLAFPASAQFIGDALAGAGLNVTERDAVDYLVSTGTINYPADIGTAVGNDPFAMQASSIPPPVARPSNPATTTGPAVTTGSEPVTSASSAPMPTLEPMTGSGTFIPAERQKTDPKAAAAWTGAFKPVGSTLSKLPAGAITTSVGGKSYDYVMGMFLQRKGETWEVISAPPGAAIPEKPVGGATVFAGGKPYIYYAGSFFIYSPEQKAYIVVAPPAGATVEYLPDTAKKAQKGGSVVYEYGGTTYRPQYRGTTLVYTVAG